MWPVARRRWSPFLEVLLLLLLGAHRFSIDELLVVLQIHFVQILIQGMESKLWMRSTEPIYQANNQQTSSANGNQFAKSATMQTRAYSVLEAAERCALVRELDAVALGAIAAELARHAIEVMLLVIAGQ